MQYVIRRAARLPVKEGLLACSSDAQIRDLRERRVNASQQGQPDEQEMQLGFHKKIEFSSPYFDDELIYSALFTPRPMEMQLECGTDKSFT